MSWITLFLLAGLALCHAQECGWSQYEDAGCDADEDEDCPNSRGNYIVNGWEARENEFPYQGTLGYHRPDGHWCGSVLISEEWVLSAAHCTIGEKPEDLRVILGEYYVDDDRTQHRNIRNVIEIIEHEDYDDYWIHDDIALLRLDVAAERNASQVPICLAEPDVNYIGESGPVSGWGATNPPGSQYPDELRYVNLRTIDNDECNDQGIPAEELFDGMICSEATSSKDSCSGDSGGPWAMKMDNGHFDLVGLVSWGYGCAAGYPGVYVDVAYYRDWITEHSGIPF